MNASVELGPKKERREESDRRMLRAAMALIRKKGISGANLAQIGLDAGYSKGLPVQRFGTKLALLIAVLEAIEDRFLRHVEKRVGDRRGCAALAERIRLQLDAVRDMPDSAIALYHLIVESMGASPDLQPRVAALQAAYHANLRSYLKQAQDMGELLPDIDIDQSARMISGTISGMSIQAIVDGHTDRLADDATYLAEMFIRHVARGPT
ncbi:MAG: TetR family transcriptional regulator C-terminal domain-containing protein [Maritimibacter sp.]|uniref:TetR/AcrR family transcriptional regulator n=1 Tax=Maritimibacter sp. TaxID=2003363 RepID=UPI001DB1E36D|nr:TetR family transcriptional regulator C-terminal domain-containing protein [Maritimibacter sp.]MBL6429004.1 TetR family transcriptional regulator C-terminal domain-containing protein [Maritimibacter sp.]